MNMTLSRILGGIGRALISAGVLILLFVAYQLWGTGLQTQAAQNRLEDEFEQQLQEWNAAQQVAEQTNAPASSSSSTSTSATSSETSAPSTSQQDPTSETTAPTTSEAPTTTAAPASTGTTVPNIPEIAENGAAIASLDIPDIGLRWTVVEGVAVEDLKKGPGHYPGTPMPGQPGNAAIAGHRTTYGAPFFRINELEAGDPIFVRTLQGQFEYRVRESLIVTPDEYDRVINQPEGDLLTLTSCHPRYSAAERYIVHAELIGESVPGFTPEQLAAQSAAAEQAGQFGAPDAEERAAVEGGAPGDADSSSDAAASANSGDGSGEAGPDPAAGGSDDDNDDNADGSGAAADTTNDNSGAAGNDPSNELAAADVEVAQQQFTLDHNEGALRDPGAWTPVLPWALLAASTWFAAWLLGRQWRKIPAYALGLPIFLLFLFMFFEKFSLLLPAAY